MGWSTDKYFNFKMAKKSLHRLLRKTVPLKIRVMYGDGIRRMEPRHFTDTVGSTEFSLLEAGLPYIDLFGRRMLLLMRVPAEACMTTLERIAFHRWKTKVEPTRP